MLQNIQLYALLIISVFRYSWSPQFSPKANSQLEATVWTWAAQQCCKFNDWLHSSSLLIFTTLELFFWWRVRKVGKAWKGQYGCNGRVINCLQQFSCIQQNPLQPQNCCYSGQSYIILQKCALFANMLARYAHMKLHWQLQTDTTFQQLLLFGGSILCSLLLKPAVFAAQYQTGQRRSDAINAGGGLLYCKCHPVARWEDSKQSKTSQDISSCSRMEERVGWNEFNGKCPFLLPVLPGTSPAIDFHIKQTFSLTLFPDVAQSAYRSQWAARHHRCILNHRELN